jgi:hypothetical protein
MHVTVVTVIPKVYSDLPYPYCARARAAIEVEVRRDK